MKYVGHTCLMIALAMAVAVAQSTDTPAAASQPVTVTGENYCILCTFGGSTDVAPSADPCAHVLALKVTAIQDAAGSDLPGWKGRTLHYLPDEKGREAAGTHDNVGKAVTIAGTLYEDAAVLAVASVQAPSAGTVESDPWEELPVGNMSSQQVL